MGRDAFDLRPELLLDEDEEEHDELELSESELESLSLLSLLEDDEDDDELLLDEESLLALFFREGAGLAVTAFGAWDGAGFVPALPFTGGLGDLAQIFSAYEVAGISMRIRARQALFDSLGFFGGSATPDDGP